jgi:hypothetical protein
LTTAYVFGPITGHGERFLPVYKRATQICEKHFDEVIGSWPDFWKPEADRRVYFERIRHTIVNADLFVGELTQPSHGVGMELQMACDRNIPLIGLAEAGAKLSDLVLGLPNLRRVIHYHGLDAMAGELAAELSRLTGRAAD